MKIVKLHEYPNLVSKCCSILNTEWPRSEAARMQSLEKSNDNFPISLLLLQDRDGNSIDSCDVVGHVKLNRELGDIIFIESLVIRPEFRNRGLGRYFMDQVEKFLETLGFREIRLTTTDKVEFYQKLGYKIVPGQVVPASSRSFKISLNHEQENRDQTTFSSPAPPPLPPSVSFGSSGFIKTLMAKHI
ncbi:N-alpha-acetyltransferase 80 [Brevipalpus obovatus]|uniref:N-alpha-acetyltransferase 80 n=1 Tax=Brevipalpus obovatus TaxID=246614 RepID=UPI003D9F5BF4